MFVIENGLIYGPEGPVQDGAVLVEGATIRAIGPRRQLKIPASAPRLDARGGYIVSGFVDMHTNGALGYELLKAGPGDLEAVTRYLPRHGVTAFVPTIVSATQAEIMQALDLARQVQAGPPLPGAEILGVHIEGPYINLEMRGAHRSDVIRNPDPEEYQDILEYADIISWVTLAPELPGALELIRAFKSKGILISAGHSLAIETDLKRAIEAGLSHVTHLFGNMGSLRRENITRVAGMVEYALVDDWLTVGIIADGYHISPSLMKLAYKAKGPDHIAIVTDASPLVGLPPGMYKLWGAEVLVEEEISYLADRSAFAGSMATMDRCLRNSVRLMEAPLEDAWHMVSATPAAILGVAHRKGTLEPGKDADIVILDAELQVIYTVTRGQLAYSVYDEGA
jgi:N-acetylglucosamine-6-phosphate deacetylase